ncbi:MAG: SurA N-terminal domain-containing protein [Rhodoferax sp.]|nr:SurA N-terminal domain-containing protein [Rhodoferax sp.]MDP3653709.1 SurA N-terminal domain-containing protein [Rhodoferax sp.]
MFDFVRKHTKVMMFLMFLLIIPAFVLVGVDGFKSINAGGDAVAKVGGHNVTQGEWDAAHKNEVDRLRASMPNLDAKLLESPEARYVTLERLVHERVLSEAAQTFRLGTTDARLARELQQNPTIASLRKPDGTLDIERYRQLAASQGLTPEGFEARVRSDLSVRQVESGIVGTAFSPAALADVALNAFFEKREVQIAKFTPADFATKVNPSDAELEAFYQANQSVFQAQESANIEYVVLDLDSVKKTITLNEADLKSYYEQNAARLSGKEERRASHILINANKDMPAADRQKAKEKAQSLLSQVRKAPESFADVARKNSQDVGSAPNGGDLDFFGRGSMVKPFEDATFAMKKGEISDLVESDFGFHIIRLTDIKVPKQRSFEELRAGIEADLKAQQAQRKYAEVADAFTNGVYEQSDSLKPIADRLKLEVKTASNLQRKVSPSVTGVLANPKLLAAVFSPDSVEKKRNTEAIEIAANQLVAARITQYTPARTLPLGEVRSIVQDRLVAKRAAEMARKEGVAKLAAWKTGGTADNLPAAVTVSREPNQPIQGPLLDAALSADTSSLPAWVGVDLGAQGYAVVRVNKVLARTPPADSKQERTQYAQWVASAENQAYYQWLKERFKVQMKVQRPTRSSIDAQTSAD